MKMDCCCRLCGKPCTSLMIDDQGLCVRCSIDKSKAAASAAGRACPSCGFDIKDGIFQCVACEMTAAKGIQQEHARQAELAAAVEATLLLLQERERLLGYKGHKHRREVRNRLRKVNTKLRTAGMIE